MFLIAYQKANKEGFFLQQLVTDQISVNAKKVRFWKILLTGTVQKGDIKF